MTDSPIVAAAALSAFERTSMETSSRPHRPVAQALTRPSRITQSWTLRRDLCNCHALAEMGPGLASAPAPRGVTLSFHHSLSLGTAVALIVGLSSAIATPTQAAGSSSTAPEAATPDVKEVEQSIPVDDRAEVLGDEAATSNDWVWTVSGDSTGLHVLVAKAKHGYAWRDVTTLAEPGVPADQWVGNACLNGDGTALAVSYAPRTFANDESLFYRGAFNAIVELESGRVTKLPFRSTMGYSSPGCGADADVAFTAYSGEAAKTRVWTVNTLARTTAKPVTAKGQLTSVAPASGGLVAARGNELVRVKAAGAVNKVATAAGAVYDVHPTERDGVVYLSVTSDGQSADASLLQGTKASTFATAPLSDIGLEARTGGPSG